MSTNYYAETAPAKTCECCGHTRPAVQIHIGLSAVGWCFALCYGPKLTSLSLWKEFLAQPNVTIKDEYDRTLTVEEMLTIIQRPGKNHHTGSNVVSHHENWDMVSGEFS